MLFSSQPFLFFFLPAVLFFYFVVLRDVHKRNVLLFFTSLFFYAWGEPHFVLVMLFSIAVNWFLGRHCERRSGDEQRVRQYFWLAVAFNVAVLFVFKYLGFVVRTFAELFGGSSDFAIVLPIGISFFTFQELSYIIDIYQGKARPFRHFMDTGLYIAFFPQLIAGPIIRFDNFSSQLLTRRESIDGFISGIELFGIGFAKKILVANALARVADLSFDMSPAALTAPLAWLGTLAYTFQIYFDFSGYSDMAIGLARMFGFDFPANFRYPYISRSIAEFWRRWHISMGSFFRDYVYFPLGGSRVSSSWRLIWNLLVVWALTGLWHGANWTFLVWGLYFFVLLVTERACKKIAWPKLFQALQWPVVFLLVMFGWVLFRANSLTHAAEYAWRMISTDAWTVDRFFLQHLVEYLPEFLVAGLASTPLAPYLQSRLPSWLVIQIIKHVWVLFIIVLALGALDVSSFNPFIYFNF